MREYAVRRDWQITAEIREIGSGALLRPNVKNCSPQFGGKSWTARNHRDDASLWACPARPGVQEGTPAGHWRTLTLLGAMTADGLVATMTIESPTDSEIFLAYLKQVLCPRLQPG
jgi:hypothetical protein